jgi:hypothetical protein
MYDAIRDSNYGLVERFIAWLPFCHHYVLVPENNNIEESRTNVTLIPHPYPLSVLTNRGFFDTKSFIKNFDFTKLDIDYVFCQQPELMYNIINALQTSRYGTSTTYFNFFHWIDSPKSRPIADYPIGFYRQVEAITLANKSYIHCDVTLDYLNSNWEEEQATTSLNFDYIKKKISYMPMSLFFWDNVIPQPIPLPKDKKVLVFNHRWNSSTGIKRLVEYTEKLDRDKYVVIITDSDAKSPKAGKPAPEWMKVKFFNRGEYRYLLENCFATMCFVDDYATWNRAVQDSLLFQTPVVCYNHPIMPHVIGKNYPYYFKTKGEFYDVLKKLEDERKDFKWKLPKHDEIFKETLITDMEKYLPDVSREPKWGREWLYHMLNNKLYHKKHLLYNTHHDVSSDIKEWSPANKGLFLSNSWEKIRLWTLGNGAYDNPECKFTELHVRPEKEKDVKKLIEGLVPKGPGIQDPTFAVKRKFW